MRPFTFEPTVRWPTSVWTAYAKSIGVAPPGRADHRGVQRAVAVELRHRNVVLEPPRHRLPQRVDQAERAIAVARSLFPVPLDDDAHRSQVVNLVELATLLGHLVVDRI